MVLGGDVMFGRRSPAGEWSEPNRDLWRAARPYIEAADLVLVNLETPICEPWPGEPGHPSFGAPAGALHELVMAGVDGVSLANNHSLDCGGPGLAATIDALGRQGLAWFGAAMDGSPLEPTWFDLDGVRVAVIGFSLVRPHRTPPETGPYVAVLDRERAAALLPGRVEQARTDGADVVVVSAHWGREGSVAPTAAQRDLGDALRRAGADVVVGHGTHTRQAVLRGDRVLAYGLGDLLFDGREGSSGAVLQVELVRDEDDGWTVSQSRVNPWEEGGTP